MKNLKYILLGIVFGIAFVKAEIISWFRIQEMFRFHSFHMFGVIGTAVIVSALSIIIIKKLKLKTLEKEEIVLNKKQFSKGTIIGSFIFGLGWAITGACPAPLFAQIGAGFGVVLITLLSALLGTFVYGVLKDKLP